MPSEAPSEVVLMKVGYHADEGLGAIVERKRKELAEAGVSFWGYGGSSCHPRTQVQPFARGASAPLWAALVTTASPFAATPTRATAFSSDGVQWQSLPPAVSVTASTHALVFDELVEVDWAIDLARYAVAIGPRAATPASAYVRFRVDKACLKRRHDVGDTGPVLRATLALRLCEPYAVSVRE